MEQRLSSASGQRLHPGGLLALEGTAVLVLQWLGSVPVLRLPAFEAGAWDAWLRVGGPGDVVMALVRAGALLAAWWLLLSTLLYGFARAGRWATAVRWAGWATPAFVHRCVDGMVAASLAGVLAGGRAGIALAQDPAPPAGRAAAAAPPRPDPAVSPDGVVLPADLDRGIVFPPGLKPPTPRGVDGTTAEPDQVVSGGTIAPDAEPSASPNPVIPPSPSEAAVMPPKATADVHAQEPPEASGLPGAPLPAGGARDGSAGCVPEPVLPSGSRPGDHRSVRPGDSLWSIAAGHVPAGERVGPYWLRVVAANRGKVASGDPNLIRPGELVTLPPAGNGAP